MLVVVFHQGLQNLADEWSNTVTYLLVQNVPVMMTAHNRANIDAIAERLKGLRANTAWQDNNNPWSGLSVFLDESMAETYHRDNAYTIGVQGFQPC